MELFYISLGIVIGWVAGRMLMIYELRRTILLLKKHVKEIVKGDFSDEDDDEDTITPLYLIENHGANFYLFDQMNDKFICQAKTIDDLAKSFYNTAAIKKALIQYEEEFFVFLEGKKIRIERNEG